jgi:hypothetical protein
MEVDSIEYMSLIEKMKSQKHIRKAIFVFKDGEFHPSAKNMMEYWLQQKL